MKPNTSYNSPFANRYASESMRYIWSDHNRLINWRKLWLFLLDCQRELGIDVGVSKEELEEIMSSVDDIDTVDIERLEKVIDIKLRTIQRAIEANESGSTSEES